MLNCIKKKLLLVYYNVDHHVMYTLTRYTPAKLSIGNKKKSTIQRVL